MKDDVVALTKKLISIDSQNPPGNERAIALFIKRYLGKKNITARLYEFKKNRTNVVCRIPSRKHKKTIILTPHIDTVPAGEGWKYEPFSGKIIDGKMYGRGASDCKSNVAVALYLAGRMKQHIRLINLDVVFAFCADEETGSKWGTIPLIKKLKNIDYGIVLDSDDFDIVVAQKGLLHVRVDIFGRQAHGAFPERGINAIEQAVRVLAELSGKKFLHIASPHPLLREPTLNVGRFWGGEKVNIVAGSAAFELDIRWVPSMNEKKILKKIEDILKRHAARYRITVLASQAPIEINQDIPALTVLREVLRKHSVTPRCKASFGATVINFLASQGIETFAFGFGSRGCAHSINEYVSVENLITGAQILEDYLCTLDSHIGQ